MKCNVVRLFAAAITGSLVIAGAAHAQNRTITPRAAQMTPSQIQQRYGIQGAYDGTMLHPAGHRSTAVPVTMQDGRTGEFVIPSGRADAHPVYYRDDQSGDLHPVRMNTRVTRQQVIEAPRAVRYQPEPRHTNRQPWERDALIIGGSAGAGALIGAAAGGRTGAGVGAAAGGIGGLIVDLLSRNKK
jgi:hypothetical protein